ncbi:MAG: PDDEXK nuclease domain-containing protein [Dysgonamonadaceae bacterium]|jgi:predicted nuclease of restriction endonuclease-like (RecB) superfamily|nr:PDDEXK nuclease domain-containing protein [Dysgonamonadaceae bacterium]
MNAIANTEDKMLFFAVKQIIESARAKVYRTVNSYLLESYWHIGKLIVEHQQQGALRAVYGEAVLKNLSVQLAQEFGKGFDFTNLTNMRKFYTAFPILDALRQELSWTHYRIISRLESEEKRTYYVQQSVENGWNSRELERNIHTLWFERRRQEPLKQLPEVPPIHSTLKDPYIFEFLGIASDEKVSEKSIETALINHLQKFLLELGKGFAFVARQQHITTNTSDFYIDLVFYNYYLKCFVLIDLKSGKLTHQDIGQMDMYIRMYEDLKRTVDDNPTIGIILCAEKDEAVVKYSILAENKKMFASKYLMYLPKEEELKQLIERDRQLFELNKE